MPELNFTQMTSSIYRNILEIYINTIFIYKYNLLQVPAYSLRNLERNSEEKVFHRSKQSKGESLGKRKTGRVIGDIGDRKYALVKGAEFYMIDTQHEQVCNCISKCFD